MLEPLKDEHYYSTRLRQLSDDILFIISAKKRASELEADGMRDMMRGVDCYKKILVKNLEEVIGFLS